MHEVCKKKRIFRGTGHEQIPSKCGQFLRSHIKVSRTLFSVILLTFIFDLKIDPSHTLLVLVEFNDFYETVLNYCIVHIAFHTLYVMYAILSGYDKSKETI